MTFLNFRTFDDNPHAILKLTHHPQFSINVWAGIMGDWLTGLYVLPSRLKETVYYNFLVNVLLGLMEDVLLQI
jgi:hypothetical protein